MKKRRSKIRTNRIIGDATYSTQEIAECVGAHVRTVQQWYREGLLKIDDNRPFLVLGCDLKAFLIARKESRKINCLPCEMACFRCRKASRPTGVVQVKPLAGSKLVYAGICVQCGATMHKFGTKSKPNPFEADQATTAPNNLSKCNEPFLNTDLEDSI